MLYSMILLKQVNGKSSYAAKVAERSRLWCCQLPQLGAVSARDFQRSNRAAAAVLWCRRR